MPGREHVDAGRAVVGERRAAVVLVRRADAHDVRRRQCARAVGRRVVVDVVVAGGDHVQRVRVRLDRRQLRLVEPRAAEAGVDDAHAHLAGVVEGLRDRDAGAAAAGAERPQRHDLRPGRDTGDALVVVGLRRDGAGDVGAVPVVVLRRVVRPRGAVALGDADARVLRDEVPALPVVAIAVAVVVDAVGALVAVERVRAGLARVERDLVGEVGMARQHARVDDADGDARAGGLGPRLGDVHVGVRCPGRVVAAAAGQEHLLADVLQAPERAVVAVGAERGLDGHRLGVDDVRVTVELGDGLGQLALVGADDLGVGQRARAPQRDVGVGAHVRALGGVEAGLAAHDDLGRALAVERLDLLRADRGFGRGRPRGDQRRRQHCDPTSVSSSHPVW